MGNPVSRYIRSVGNMILEKYLSHVSSDFEANKDLVNKLIGYEQTLDPAKPSPVYQPGIQYDMKKLRNTLAGYITREYNKTHRTVFPMGAVRDGYDPHGSHAGPKSSKKWKKIKKSNFKPKSKQSPQLEFLLTGQRQYR